MAKRKYSQKTIKVIFALSGNQCAHPDCRTTLVETDPNPTNVHVVAHVCHIYGVSGPRSNHELSENELNSPQNLILLCPTHHSIVDGQDSIYTVEILKQWKNEHEDAIAARLASALDTLPSDVLAHPYFPTALVDQKIHDDLATMRRSRFFTEYDQAASAITFAEKLTKGELSGGTSLARCQALSWCARLLVTSEHITTAKSYLAQAKSLALAPETSITAAFLEAFEDGVEAALPNLATINLPEARTAALILVSSHNGPREAIDWFTETDLQIQDLDGDGVFIVLKDSFLASEWDCAFRIAQLVSDVQLVETPVLHHMVATANLLSTVPIELRAIVCAQVPINAAQFPLASDARALENRRIAVKQFSTAARVAAELGYSTAAAIDDDYALWLQLRDPENHEQGKSSLRTKLRDLRTGLRLVHLGVEFGVPLDHTLIEREISRELALFGEPTHNTVVARLALVSAQPTAEEAAAYLEHHLGELREFVETKTLYFLRIELLSRGKQREKALACYKELESHGITDAEKGRIKQILASEDDTDAVADRLAQFDRTDSLIDLYHLVAECEANDRWHELSKYCELLFQRTRDAKDAERLAKVYLHEHMYERLRDFLSVLGEFRKRSPMLQQTYCWALYYVGDIHKLRDEVRKLADTPADANLRHLRTNIAISTGDWNSLSTISHEAVTHSRLLKAEELLQVGQLATFLGFPSAKELISEAANRGSKDPEILSAAYFTAVTAGWEDEGDIFGQWLQKAAALSDEHGPIQRASLRELVDLKPEWERQESEMLGQFARGEIPSFMLAKCLNRSIVHLTLFPALSNVTEKDLRRRKGIAAYSGSRAPAGIEAPDTIALDVTAILSLGLLGALDDVVQEVRNVYIPHGTMVWLLQEHQKAKFHQPSRIRQARNIRDYLATNIMREFQQTAQLDGDLLDLIGFELAALIAEANAIRRRDGALSFVVHSGPVYRVSSLMEEEADLSTYGHLLTGCQPIIEKLREVGRLTSEEYQRCTSYLGLQERPLENQPEVEIGSVLYLDRLAVMNFMQLELLERLDAVGFQLVASTFTVDEANELLAYEKISSNVIALLEQIRISLHRGICSGKILFGKFSPNFRGDDEISYYHPSADFLELGHVADVIICDDRFFNRTLNMKTADGLKPIVTSLDLLLSINGTQNEGRPTRAAELKTQLRRFGFFFVPIEPDELFQHLSKSHVLRGVVVETAELKAIRENILHSRMNDWLQFPQEGPWLVSVLNAFEGTLRKLWTTDSVVPDTRARSNWIADQLDVSGWMHRLEQPGALETSNTGRMEFLLRLLVPPSELAEVPRKEYWKWVDERFLEPIQVQMPEVYEEIVEMYRNAVQQSLMSNSNGGIS